MSSPNLPAGDGAPPPPSSGPVAPPPPPGRLRRFIPFATLGAAVLAAYGHALSAPFVFDDHSNLVQATRVHAQDLSPSSLAPALRDFPLGRWLAHLSFAMNHALGGLEPAGYRAVNLAFHAASAALVLLLARRVLARAGGLDPARTERAALVAALLFALHPVQTQAVTYVVQRMTSMGGCFALLSLLLWVDGRAAAGAGRWVRLAGSLVAAFLAFSCKETFAVLPALALLLDVHLFPGLAARLRRHPAVVAALATAAVATAAFLVQTYAGFLDTEALRYGVSTGERLLTQPGVLWHYLSLLALPLPSRLHLDYFWPASRSLLDPPSTLLALAGLGGLVALAIATRRRLPLLGFAVAWFLAGLAIEQSILPLHFVFEHRLYLPSLGCFLLAASAIERLLARTRIPTWAVAAPALAALALAAGLRNADWKDPATLYADPAGYGPGSAGNLVTLGRLLHERRDLAGAERVLLQAQALEPDHPGPLVNLGTVAADAGRPDEAVGFYRRALAMNPRIPEAWFGLSWTLYRTGRIAECQGAARAGLAANPAAAPLRVPLSACLDRAGDRAGALRELQEAVRLDPRLWIAWLNLGEVLLDARRTGEALQAALTYVNAVPADPLAHSLVGRVLAALGRTEPARAALAEALRLDPGNREARRALAALDGR